MPLLFEEYPPVILNQSWQETSNNLFQTANRPPSHGEYRASPVPAYARGGDEGIKYGESSGMNESATMGYRQQTPQRHGVLPSSASSSMNVRSTPAPPPRNSLFSQTVSSVPSAKKPDRLDVGDSKYFTSEASEAQPPAEYSRAGSSKFWTSAEGGVETMEETENEPAILDRWVTVFGFPPSYTSAILTYFHNLGQIQRVKHANNQGNWIHILYRTKLQADKVLGKNGKILENGTIMIGVMPCRDASVLEEQVEGISLGEMEQPVSSLEEFSVVPTESQPTPKATIWSKFMETVIGI